MDQPKSSVSESGDRRGVSVLLRKIGSSGEIFSILIALIILSVFFSVTSPYFLTVRNILNFTMNTSILGIMAVGLFIAMVIGEIDVSQYSIVALSTAIMVISIRNGMNSGAAIAMSFGVAILCGIVNGSLVAFLHPKSTGGVLIELVEKTDSVSRNTGAK